ncbi:MAG: lamin tail domain-containing protein [Bacteroidales bacterium]|nr:lamin tail domain-containing protein [Lentimicrobiaceae bacterium]MDD5694177.1 lamin tail domain-containing protein [Bacteroidales bacterium]
MKPYIFFYAGLPLMAILLTTAPNHAQTALLPGDLVITGFNMDNPDEVSVVFMVAIESGTEIRFTDNGWKASGTFRTGEGIDIWVAGEDHPAGEEMLIPISDMALSSSGDQILVYQGTEEAPLFVAAINDEGDHTWQDDATDAGTSALPAGLENGVTCVALTETDNMLYNRSLVSGSREELLLSVHNYQNWAGSDTQRQTLSTAGFTIGGSEDQPAGFQIVTVNGGTAPFVNEPFYLEIVTVDSTGNPCPVDENTLVGLSRVSGTGYLYGNTQDTLPAGQYAMTVSGVRYNVAENNVTLAVMVLAGTPLEPDTSNPFSVLPPAQVVINEIHYNGPEAGTDTTEFLEICNAGEEALDLGGYSFEQGITFTFPSGATLAAGEYAVIAYSSEIYAGQGYAVYQWQSGTLSNTGETLLLRSPGGLLIDSVTYGDGSAWGNSAPDGYGPSLELAGVGLDNSESGNWKASHVNGGTPGQANCLAPVSATWAGGYAEQEHNWAVPSNWLWGQSAGEGTQVTIPFNVNAILIVDHPFQCQDLLLEPGAALTIAQGNTLTVGNTLTLQADSCSASSLLLEDDAATVMVNGSSQVQLFLSGGTSRDPENAIYHYVAPPVSQISAGGIFPGSAYVRKYSEPLQQWDNLSSGSPLFPLCGYSVWLAGGSALVSFTGELNSGSLTVSGLTYTPPGIPSYQPEYAGYNLIGNPYPSSLNWDHSSILKDHVQHAIYFWNPELDGYSSYINGVGNNPETTDSIIPAMQGFFIRVDVPGQTGSVTFSNSARLHEVTGFYRTGNELFPLFRITSSGNGRQDQTTLCLREGSTGDFDAEFDAHKLFGGEQVPHIYSVSDDGEQLSVSAYPSLEDMDGIIIGFSANSTGSYRLTFAGMETFPQGTVFLLEDLAVDSLVDCFSYPFYDFTFSTGDDPGRFILHFTPISGQDEITAEEMILFPSGGNLNLVPPHGFNGGMVTIHDLTGRLIHQETVGTSPLLIPMKHAKGWLIVRIVADSRVISKKVYLP